MEENLPVQSPVFLIEADKIRPNPHQPRKVFDEEQLRDLANSIREVGILQPLVVTKVEQPTEAGTEVHYELIAGERRLMASKLVGLERVPAVIRNVQLDRERLEMAIIENVQRAQLNPIEAARAYAKLQDQFGLTQREVAARIGKSREVIANTVRLLNLPTRVQDAVSAGALTESQARLLLGVEDIAQQEGLFDQILRENLSVRGIKARILRWREQQKPQVVPEAVPVDAELGNLQRELEEVLGTKVMLEKSGETGKLTIVFYSPEELHGIVDRLRQPQQVMENPEIEAPKTLDGGYPPEEFTI